MARRARCWRVHSALTQKVKAPKWRELRFHGVFPGVASGQLRFLGSFQPTQGRGLRRCLHGLHEFAQTGAGAREARHHRAHRNLQHAGCVGIGHVFERHEQQHGTLFGGQAQQAAFNVQGAVGVLGRRWQPLVY